MRYTDYLNRSIDRLTPAVWEQLLQAPESVRPICAAVQAFCPYCRATLNVDVALTVAPLPITSSDETLIELAAVTDADIALRAELITV
jgi:hypothetical protein